MQALARDMKRMPSCKIIQGMSLRNRRREMSDTQEQTICSMYRDGTSLRTLELAFEKSFEEIIGILHRNGVVRQEEGESWEAFVERVREDVKHGAAGNEAAPHRWRCGAGRSQEPGAGRG